jgi:hypothetical protein
MVSYWCHWQKIRVTTIYLLYIAFCLTCSSCSQSTTDSWHIRTLSQQKPELAFKEVPSDVPHGILTIHTNDRDGFNLGMLDDKAFSFPSAKIVTTISYRLVPGQHIIKIKYYLLHDGWPYGNTVIYSDFLEEKFEIQKGKETVFSLLKEGDKVRLARQGTDVSTSALLVDKKPVR